MKETVTQRSLEPVLHGFLLKDHKSVLPSKSKVLKLFGLISTQEA